METIPGSRPRGSLRLLVDRDFGSFFWGKLVAAAGVWAQSVAATIVVYHETRSVVAVSVVSVAQFAPQLLLAPAAGSWADEGNIIRQLLAGRVICLTGSALLAGSFLLDLSSTGVVLAVFACSLMVGVGFVVGGPAMQSVIPDLVSPAELSTAMTLNTMPMTMARIVGPAIGAFSVEAWGPALSFGLAALSHLTFLCLILLIRVPTATAYGGHPQGMRAGLSYIRHHGTILAMLIATGFLAAGSEPSLTLAPSLAETLGGSTRTVGLLTLTFGCGAFFALVFAPVFRRLLGESWTAQLGLLLLGIGMGLSAISVAAWQAYAAFVIAGAGFSIGIAAFSTLIQRETPREYRGRVMAWWLVAFVGSRPLAAFALGTLADLVNARAALVATSAAILLAAVMIAVKLRPARPAVDGPRG